MKKAVAAYIEKEGKVLTIERESGKYKGYRSMPHGMVEDGEALEEAVIREAKEESGFTIKVIKKIAEYKTKFGPRHGSLANKEVTIYIFQCNIIGGGLSDKMNPEWLEKEELLEREDVVPTIKIAIETLKG